MIHKKLYQLLFSADKQWMIRTRKITTASVFSQLAYACFERRGLTHTLQKSGCDFTAPRGRASRAQALSLARKKIPEHLFRNINQELQQKSGPRRFCIDGSKVHVHPSFLLKKCTTRTNNQNVSRPAKRPLMMLSSLLDVDTRTCYDSRITTHFNERKSAIQHFDVTKPGDTVIFDRGYFSSDLFHHGCQKKLKLVFRVKRDALKSVKLFYNSTRTCETIHVASHGQISRAYLRKYVIDGKSYICLTNFELSCKEAKDLYSLRWRVETSFRRLKTDLSMETSHSMLPDGFVQEIEIRILVDTVSVLTSNLTSESVQLRRHTLNKLRSYFRSIDYNLMAFHIIQIVCERHLTYQSVINILDRHSSEPVSMRTGNDKKSVIPKTGNGRTISKTHF